MFDLPDYVWIVVFIGVLGIPAATCVALYRGALAVGIDRRGAGTVATAAGVGWACWIVAAGVLAAEGAFRQDSAATRPWIGVAILGAFLSALLATRIPVVARIISAPGTMARFALPQVPRAIGIVFLIVFALHALPAAFALPAGLGDIATGIAAPFVARRNSRVGALWFNILGLVDLVVAVSVGYLAGLGPVRILDVTPSTQAITLLPLALIPLTAVPLAAVLHVVSLRAYSAAVSSGSVSSRA